MTGIEAVVAGAADPGSSHWFSSRTDSGFRVLRLVVLAFVFLDASTSLIAASYGVAGAGPSGPSAILETVLGFAAVAAVMWIKPVVAAVLSVLTVALAFELQSTGVELWLLVVSGIVVCAHARPYRVLALVLAQVAFIVGYSLSGGWYGWRTTVIVSIVAAISDGSGLLAGRLLRARDQRLHQVRQIEQENASIRATERLRLADDLQLLLTGSLDDLESMGSNENPSATARDLRDALLCVQASSRSLLDELRTLLTVLRVDHTGSEDRLVVGADRPARWLNRLQVRELGTALALLSVLLIVSALLRAQAGLLDPDLWVELLGLTAGAVAFWRPRIAAALASGALALAVTLPTTGYHDLIAVGVLSVLGALARSGRPALWLLVVGLVGYGALLSATVDERTVPRVVLALSVGLTGIALGTFVRHLLIARRQAQRQLVELMAERTQLAGDERSAVARELHDVVAHQLSVTSMVIMAASDSEDREVLAETLARVRRVTGQARQELGVLLLAMRGPQSPIGDQGPLVFPSTCAYAIERQLSEAGFRPTVAADPAADRLDTATQRTLTRIMREATSNILRYAEPNSVVELTLLVQPAGTSLTVQSAMASRTTSSELSLGWGLRGIRERVDLSRGTFSAGPVKGRWVVAVTLPELTAISPGNPVDQLSP